MRNRLQALGAWIAFVSSLSLAGIFFAEAVMRLFELGRPDPRPWVADPDLFVRDSACIYKTRPGVDVTLSGGRRHYVTGEHGLRCGTRGTCKPRAAHGLRVLISGDEWFSPLSGGTRIGAVLLEEKLRSVTGVPVFVLDAATPGYEPGQAVQRSLALLDRLAVNVVLLVINSGNDIQEHAFGPKRFEPLTNLRVFRAMVARSWGVLSRSGISDGSLVHWSRILSWRFGPAASQGYNQVGWLSRNKEGAKIQVRRIFEKIRILGDDCRRRGVEFLVFVAPSWLRQAPARVRAMSPAGLAADAHLDLARAREIASWSEEILIKAMKGMEIVGPVPASVLNAHGAGLFSDDDFLPNEVGMERFVEFLTGEMLRRIDVEALFDNGMKQVTDE